VVFAPGMFFVTYIEMCVYVYGCACMYACVCVCVRGAYGILFWRFSFCCTCLICM